jgi:polyribonucleotide nucleotidyltransferase
MGDMDFKIAGTKKGITAVQADIKIQGLPLKIVMEAVVQACDAKSRIIDIMNEAIKSPKYVYITSFLFLPVQLFSFFIFLLLFFRKQKNNWPVSDRLEIPAHKRAKFLGVGGSNLKKLMVQTGVQVRCQ